MNSMDRRLFLKSAVAGAMLKGMRPSLVAADGSGAKRPNIVYFLIDDLGWADVGYQGGPYKTPNIDRMALGGARLEQFYVLPVCSPTRAALMTGRYPMRHGLQVGVVRPWAQYGLPLEERTLAQALKEAGYLTAICGKWHLGHFDPAYLPTRRGFDRQYGHYNGALDYFTHIRDGGFDWHRDDKVCRDQGYSTELLARETVRIIEEHGGKRPLFLYVPFNAIHSPLQAPEKYMEPYRNMPEVKCTVGGMMAALDEAIGQIVSALDRKGLRNNTLILFSSDNGGTKASAGNGPFRAGKATLYEGGVRVAAFANWEGVIQPGTIVNEPLHIVDWYPTLLTVVGGSLEQKLPLDGKDIWPTITSGRPSPHEEILLNATPTHGAIRVSNWKLVVGGNRPEAEQTQEKEGEEKKAKRNKSQLASADAALLYELFDLKSDPAEKNNLAATMPEKVKELLARYEAYAKQAVPPKYQGSPGKGFKVPAVWGEEGIR